ncbi:MAG: hypothetical protein ACXWP4_09465 [Polyangiales bacterium]
MKLFNVLSVTAFGVLFAVGCSSSDTTTTDSGTTADTGGTTTETGTDTGTPPTETGGDDTGTAVDAAACSACTDSKCKSEKTACAGSTDCVAVLKCVDDCKGDSTCANACISDETKPGVKEANALLTCAQDKCAMECGL